MDFEDIFIKTMLALCVAIVAVVVIWLCTALFNPDNCSGNTYQCRAHQAQICIEAEIYTKDQCIVLVGGGK